MIKAIFIDGDGMALRECELFSESFSREHSVPLEKITPFFTGPFRQCQRGQADLKKELEPFLLLWGWKDGVDAFLQYWFAKSAVADEQVIAEVKKLREKGYTCYLATNQEKYRGDYIKKTIRFEDHFDGFFFSYDLGYQKSDKGFFHTIMRKLGLEPDEIVYFDDEDKNVEVAKELGILAKKYTTPVAFAEEVAFL